VNYNLQCYPYGSMSRTPIENVVREYANGNPRLYQGLIDFMSYPISDITVPQLEMRIRYLKDMDNASGEITLERYVSHMLALNLLMWVAYNSECGSNLQQLSHAVRERIYNEKVVPLQLRAKYLSERFTQQLMPMHQPFSGWPDERKATTDQVQGHSGDAGVGTSHAAGGG